MRNLGAAFGQVGFQVQDAAVQLQAGTNALTVLAQQGSQVAGIFGPAGAVVGAFVAVGAAVGSTLLPSLFSSKDAMEDLEVASDGLDDALMELANGAKVLTEELYEMDDALARVGVRAGSLDARNVIGSSWDAARGVVDDLLNTWRSADWKNDAFAMDLSLIQRKLGVTKDSAVEIRRSLAGAAIGQSASELAELRDTWADVLNANPGASDEFVRSANDIIGIAGSAIDAQASKEQLDRAYQDIGGAKAEHEREMSRDDRARASAASSRAAERSKAEAQRAVDRIKKQGDTEREAVVRKYEEDRDALAEAAAQNVEFEMSLFDDLQDAKLAKLKEIDDRVAEQKQAAIDKQIAADKSAMNQRIAVEKAGIRALATLAGSANDVIAAAGAEGSRIADGLFLAQKAINVASIISDTHKAAAAAGAAGSVAGLPGFLSSQSAVLAMGYANAALVAGLSVGTVAAGRQFGGPIQPMAAHPINEAGTPEILNQAGRQYLLPTGKGGTIEPMGKGQGPQQANVTIISNGTPQTVTGTQISRGEISVMINDANRATERRINGSLATGRGDTATSLQRGFKSTRNLR